MRNWNNCTYINTSELENGFYSTYEELKQGQIKGA